MKGLELQHFQLRAQGTLWKLSNATGFVVVAPHMQKEEEKKKKNTTLTL